jgi:hypothetical protein
MMTCEEVRELIPWYVTGQIHVDAAERMADHFSGCPGCQEDFVEAAWMRRLVMNHAQAAAPRKSIRARVERKAGIVDLASIDVGSFLIGLKLGISASSKRYPVYGSLRVLGHNVRIVGKRRGKEKERVQKR